MPTTPNYTYNLPVVGGDFETWGTLLNTNWSDLDTDLKAANDAIDAVEASVIVAETNANTRVLKAGDTMTGALTLPATEPSANLHAVKKQYVDNGELSQRSRYLFSTVLDDLDPGAGKIGLNNNNGNLATSIYVSTSCTNGKTTPAFANFVNGVVVGLSRADRTIYYRITSAVNNTSWYTLTVVRLNTGITFSSTAADAPILLTFLGYLEPEEESAPVYTDHLLTSWSLSSFEAVAHGLGALPTDVRAIFKCKNAVSGYTVGAFLYLAVGSNNERGGYSVSSTATSVYFSTGDVIYLVQRGGATSTSIGAITPANWDVILRVWP